MLLFIKLLAPRCFNCLYTLTKFPRVAASAPLCTADIARLTVFGLSPALFGSPSLVLLSLSLSHRTASGGRRRLVTHLKRPAFLLVCLSSRVIQSITLASLAISSRPLPMAHHALDAWRAKINDAVAEDPKCL